MIRISITREHENVLQVIYSYYELTRPRIIPLLLMIAAASMWIASKGMVNPMLLLITLTSITLGVASAQTLNAIYDRDIDYQMERTRHLPIPSGRVQPVHALIFAIILATLSFYLLATFVNFLSAILVIFGIFFYVVIYTHFLKRNTSMNVVIGGGAGAIPALVAWAAVTGTLSWTAWWIFCIVVLWTPPHFWSSALVLRDDYAKVGIPILPVVSGSVETARQIFIYTVLLILSTFFMYDPLGMTDVFYICGAFFLGAIFIQKAWVVLENPDNHKAANNLFSYSIFYMILLCIFMVIDSLPITHQIIKLISS
ncbi:MAG: protoheme IX farnesyltransferase [Calothrix sp. C42_A2020_038]|nr:protoheme IX farnesyltransferase [Calothrix sp. C42_A2020_038]